jgi:hypothetical protein
MNRRLHLILVVPPLDFFLDATDAQHRAIPGDEIAGRVSMRQRVESFESLTLVGIPDGHSPLGWYSTIRPPDMSNLNGTMMRLSSAARTGADRPAGRTAA